MWTRTSDLLASMKGLRNLEIVLWDRSAYGTPADWENILLLLNMLNKVKQARRYVVTLDQHDGGEAVQKLRDKEVGVRRPFDLRFGRGDDGERFFWLV
jgi:hypothetical protein